MVAFLNPVTLYNGVTLIDTYATIQEAIDAALDGYTIDIAAGVYDEDLNINKAVTLLGANAGTAGSDGGRDAATGVGETTILGDAKITSTGDVTIDGVRFLNDATTTGNGAGNPALLVAASGGVKTVTNSVFWSSVVGGGNEDRAFATQVLANTDINFTDNLISGSAASGFSGASWHRGIWFDGGNGVDLVATGNVLTYIRSGMNLDLTGTATASVSGNTFNTNGTAVSIGVDADGLTTANNTFNEVGTEFNLQNLSTGFTFDLDGDVAAITGTLGNDIAILLGGSAADALLGTDGIDRLVGNNGNDGLTGREGADYLSGGAGTDTANYADTLSEASFGVVADADPFTGGNQAGWSIDGDGGDTVAGVERVVDGGGNVFLLVGNGGYATIQAAVDATVGGETIVVADGTYAENVVIDVSGITLVSANGRGAVTIQGVGAGGELGAIQLTPGVDDVTIGGTGQGFTIVGIDGAPGLEKAAIYLQGSHDGLNILDNEIVANGDAGLSSEFAGAITNMLIDGNEFSGQTFLGAQPGGIGFTNQFTEANVPRQLVVLGNGNNAQLSNNITFTNNLVSGDAGGISSNDGISVQGNNLITIDAKNSTISDNEFTGYTDRFATAIRARGENTDIENNILDDATGQSRGITVANQGVPGSYSGNVVNGGATADVITSMTDGADELNGNGGGDTLAGSGGADDINGGAGNDLLGGGTGNDDLDGGADFDTAAYAGNRADFSFVVEYDGNGRAIGFTSVTDNAPAAAGDEGTDTLTSIETLQFANGAISAANPVHLYDENGDLVNSFTTIQAAVNAASDGFTIEVGAGTYVEQVVVNGLDDLTIVAATGAEVTIQAPADVVETARSASDREVHGVVTVLNGTNVTIENINVDGFGRADTISEGGGAGQANFYGVFYRNASGTLTDVDVTGVRDPYPGLLQGGGTTVGGEPIVSGNQRGVGVVVDNDTVLDFTMTGGSISDFQKNATVFSKANLNVTGVTITGGGAQTINAQNGIQVTGSTGTIDGNTITGIGYAGVQVVYSAAILAFGNTDLNITDNVITGSNIDTPDGKVVGIYILDFGTDNSGGEISGNTISHVDGGISIDQGVQPNGILVENNTITDLDLADPYVSGVYFEPTVSLAVNYDVDGANTPDYLAGAAGDDVLSGLGEDDVLLGNDGDDALDGGAGDDDITGGTGNDEIDGGDDDDTIDGNGGADLIDGGAGNDDINGGGGRDTVYFSAGTDYAHGGAGNDTLVLSGVAGDYSIVIVGLNHYEVTRTADGAFTEAVSFENVTFISAVALDAVDDSFTVDAGAVRTLTVRGNDAGSGLVIAANVTSGSGTAAPAASGTVVDLDLTTAYKSLDAGDTASVTILYLLSDGSSSDVAEVTVTVNGVADAIGAVTDANGGTNAVDEGLAAGAAVGVTALAADPDAGSTVSYSLTDDADGAFQIDSNTGVVTTARALDREGADGTSQTITVLATSSDGTTSSEDFTIAINDVSDSGVSATTDSNGVANAVNEGAAATTVVGITALATDADVGETVSYSLDDDAGGAFQINATSGVITVANGALIDREMSTSVSVTVRSTSSDTSFTTETFSIAVNDVDEFDATTPVDTSGASGGAVTENAVSGSSVGIIALSGDADATTNTITYSLADDDGGRFVIGPVSGEVLTGTTAIDREAGATRSITVRATSADGSFADSVFTIDVGDADEFDVTAPVDADGTVNQVNASSVAGTLAGVTASASDADATTNTITYSLLAGGSDFDIDSSTGVVTVAATFNSGGAVTRTVTVQAASSDGSVAQSDFTINVLGGVTTITGTINRDTLNGTAGDDIINALAANDSIFGNGGNDTIYGDDGNDSINGGLGNDQMEGGLGNDTYYVDSASDAVIETGGGGTRDVVYADISIAALYANVEELYLAGALGTENLNGTGNSLANKIVGNSGDNVIDGGLGNDNLLGGDGLDTLYGGDGVDQLNGGAGNDTLNGGVARDTLTGGLGADRFVFDFVPAAAATADRVLDFSTAQGDKVVLSAAVFSALGGVVNAGNIAYGIAAADADDYLIFDAATGHLYYDADGNGAGAAMRIVSLDFVPTLTTADFEFIA